MTKPTGIDWKCQSDKIYRYWIYTLDMEFEAMPGNYIFSRRSLETKHTAIYIGQTSDLSERFDQHHQMPCIKRHGATHICVHQSDVNEQVRMLEEKDIVKKYDPVCNKQ